MHKKNTLSLLSVLLLCVLFVNSCTKDSASGPVTPAPASVPSPVATTKDPCDTVTYEAVIKPIVDVKCLSCHGDVNPFAGFSLNSYEALKGKGESGKLEARLIKGQPSFMPMGGILPQEQRDLFACWIKNGFKK